MDLPPTQRAETLATAFTWARTSEGLLFWFGLYLRLAAGEDVDLPLEYAVYP